MIDNEKLEQTLLTNWSRFLDVRKLRAFAAEIAGQDEKSISKLTISRFELVEGGFILWLEYLIDRQFTTETLLSWDGKLSHLQTI